MTETRIPSTPNLVARFRRNIRRSIEIADQIAGVRLGGPSRQKLVRRFDGADFLGDECPVASRIAALPKTASYSRSNAVEHNLRIVPASVRRNSTLLVPRRLRNAATTPFVSSTSLIGTR